MKLSFKNIVFDWSGVINDNVDNHVAHISHMFESAGGHAINRRELRRKWTQPYMKFFNLYFPDWTFDDQRKYYIESIDKFSDNQIYPGIKKILLDLKSKGANLFVITGDLADSYYKQEAEYGLKGIFTEVVIDSHDKYQDLVRLIKKYKMEKDDTCFIGDTTHETQCAKAADIKSIAVTWGMNTPSRLMKAEPNFIASSAKQLRTILLK